MLILVLINILNINLVMINLSNCYETSIVSYHSFIPSLICNYKVVFSDLISYIIVD